MKSSYPKVFLSVESVAQSLFSAGDVMAADSYRKAVRELDDAFLAIHSGALNYTTLPPFPAPYKSLTGRSIPCNLRSLSFPPGCTWHYLPYQYLPQSGIPGAYTSQFHMPTTSGSPYMYSAYISQTGQRLPLHQVFIFFLCCLNTGNRVTLDAS